MYNFIVWQFVDTMVADLPNFCMYKMVPGCRYFAVSFVGLFANLPGLYRSFVSVNSKTTLSSYLPLPVARSLRSILYL